MRPIRPATLNERLYEAGQKLSPPFAIQLVVKGTGRLDPAALEQGITRLVQGIPPLGYALQGRHWVNGESPVQLSIHEDSIPDDWNADLFQKPLDLRNGPIAAFHYYPKDSTLVFRCPHALMDARGGLYVLRMLFSLLRGENQDIHPGFPADHDLRKQLAPSQPVSREGYSLKWPGWPAQDMRHQTLVLTLNHRMEGAVARIAAWLSRELEAHCRFLVPVDLRRHAAVPDAAANQTLPIYLHADPEEDWTTIQGRLLSGLLENQELAREPFEGVARQLPGKLLAWVLETTVKQAQKKNRYPMSGILSDIGEVDLQEFSTEEFRATSLISLPVYVPMAPFCLNVTAHGSTTHLAMTLPKSVDAEGLINSLQTFLTERKESDKPASPEMELAPDDLAQMTGFWAEALELEPEEIPTNQTFLDLGGDSLALLSMLTEVADEWRPSPRTAFLETVLNTGGQLTIRELWAMLATYRDTGKSSSP